MSGAMQITVFKLITEKFAEFRRQMAAFGSKVLIFGLIFQTRFQEDHPPGAGAFRISTMIHTYVEALT